MVDTIADTLDLDLTITEADHSLAQFLAHFPVGCKQETHAKH